MLSRAWGWLPWMGVALASQNGRDDGLFEWAFVWVLASLREPLGVLLDILSGRVGVTLGILSGRMGVTLGILSGRVGVANFSGRVGVLTRLHSGGHVSNTRVELRVHWVEKGELRCGLALIRTFDGRTVGGQDSHSDDQGNTSR